MEAIFRIGLCPLCPFLSRTFVTLRRRTCFTEHVRLSTEKRRHISTEKLDFYGEVACFCGDRRGGPYRSVIGYDTK